MAMDTDGVSVTVSIGVATLEQLSSASPESLLKAADEALYAAKAQGRNRTSQYAG
jgi:diguanylate cyclase (GGDEF)-like protein